MRTLWTLVRRRPHLLSRFGPKMLSRLSFSALPLSPYAGLQKYFRQPIPIEELEEERARSLSVFGVPGPSASSEQVRRYESGDRDERFFAALSLAGLEAGRLARGEALDWLRKALASHPERPTAEQRQAVRRVALSGLGVSHRRTRSWFDALPLAQRDSDLGRSIGAVLADYETRLRRREGAYLLSRDLLPRTGSR